MEGKASIVGLIDPKMCEACRFTGMEIVPQSDGSIRRVLRCRRKDCDNWTTVVEGIKPTIRIEDLVEYKSDEE
jgi:hypothetical protein